MKQCTSKLIVIAIIGSLSLFAAQNSFSMGKKPQKACEPQAECKQLCAPVIDLQTAYQLWKGNKAFFIDARSDGKYREEHIPGAVNTPAKHAERDWRNLNTSLRDDIVVTYCANSGCNLSDCLAKSLIAKGFSQVYVFSGGIAEWKAASYPLDLGWGRRTARVSATEKEQANTQSAVPVLNLDTVFQLWKGDKVFFVDALPKATYKQGHIPGALNLPVKNIEKYWDNINFVLKNDILVVYCASEACNASDKLAAALVEKGYTQVYVFKGGVKEWKSRYYPIEKGWQVKQHRPKELIREVKPAIKGITFLDKLGRGSVNIITGPWEIPIKGQAKVDETGNNMTYINGMGEGFIWMFLRGGAGLWDIVSSPTAIFVPETSRVIEPPTVFDYDKLRYRPDRLK